MTVLEPQPPGIPSPRPSRLAASYWEGCRAGELRFQRCDTCGTLPPRPAFMCPRCHGVSLSWHASAGLGTVYSWTVVWRPQHPAFTVPYAPAIVELDEGVRVLSSLVSCELEEVHPGMRVRVIFSEVNDEITLPYFAPLASAQ